MTVGIIGKRGAARRKAVRLAFVWGALALSLFAFDALAAQEPRVLEGRVVRAGQGAPGVPVTLHRVTRDARGPVQVVESGADGRFRFALPPADTAAGFTVFFATAQADGVRYFGPVVHADEVPEGYAITVFDTTSSPAAADSVRVARRDVFLMPSGDGGLEVSELVTVRNGGGRTLFPAGDRPLFGLAIPPPADDFEAGEGAAAGAAVAPPGEVVRMGNVAWVTVPLVPGAREFFFRYRVPGAAEGFALPVGRPTDTLFVYVHQPAPGVEVAGLGAGEPFEAQGERFQRYRALALTPERRVAIAWGGGGPPVDPRLAAVVVAGAVLAAGAFWALRRRPAAG